MKSARLLLATLSLAALAACGTESITGPHSAVPAVRNVEEAVDDGSTTIQSTLPSDCEGTVVVTTDPSGGTLSTCTTDEKGGPYVGSGG